MINLARIACIASAIALTACGGGGGGSPGSITGTIHGKTFAVQDAISASFSGTDSNGNAFSEVAIIMADAKALCTTFGANQQPKNLSGAVIALADFNGTAITSPTMPGTFSIFSGTGTPPSMLGAWNAIVTDATCMDVTASEAKGTSGTIQLKSINNGAYDGSFDVVLDSGDHVTGSFSPEACPALATALASQTPPACI